MKILKFDLQATAFLLVVLQSCLANEWERMNERMRLQPESNLESYKSCNVRCDRGRGGGFDEYVINCDMRYSTEAEKLECRHDCQHECPPDLCMEGSLIICPGIPEEIEREEMKKQENLRNLAMMQDQQKEQHAKRKEEAETKLKEEKDKQLWIIIGLSIGLVILIAFCIAYLCYVVRRDRRKRISQQIRKLSVQQEQYPVIAQPRGSGDAGQRRASAQSDPGPPEFYAAPPIQNQVQYPRVSRAHMEPPLEGYDLWKNQTNQFK